MRQEPFQPALHFRAEVHVLQRQGLAAWDAVATLGDGDLRHLARSGEASEARLRRLRAQARLMQDVGVSSAEAALLLHAGIPDAAALAGTDPAWLLRQLGRFHRQLLGRQAAPPTAATVRSWIALARADHSPN